MTTSSSRSAPLATEARRALALVVLAAGAIAAVAPSPCRGAFVLTASDVLAAPGSSGAFDVFVTNTNLAGGDSFDVGAFILELELSGGLPGVQFTDVTIATTLPYIFASSGTIFPGADPFTFDAFPNAGFLASDAEFAPEGSREVAPGQVFGIARVSYVVDPSALPGAATIGFGGATSVSDFFGGAVPFATMEGTFAVVGVPEPSSVILAASGLALLVASHTFRRSSRRAA